MTGFHSLKIADLEDRISILTADMKELKLVNRALAQNNLRIDEENKELSEYLERITGLLHFGSVYKDLTVLESVTTEARSYLETIREVK